MPEEKKKSWFKRHWIITILGVLILLMVIAGVSNSSNSTDSSKGPSLQLISNDYPCPDLSDMKLQNYDALMQTWTAQVPSYKSGNLEVVYTYNSQIEENKKIIYCDAGSEEGQNANWVYCGDFIRPIVAQYTDSGGSIIKKKSIEVTFDKNTKQYLSAKCDTYTLM